MTYWTGTYDGYDRDGPIPEWDSDRVYETLNGNLIIEEFLYEEWFNGWKFPAQPLTLVLPHSLFCRTEVPDHITLVEDHQAIPTEEELGTFYDILDKYWNNPK